MRRIKSLSRLTVRKVTLLAFLFVACVAAGHSTSSPNTSTSIFAPASTPASSIVHLSIFVLVITGIIFAVVFTLLVYAIIKFRERAVDVGREPAQVYGSTQIELAWTIIPILIVVVLCLATARVIHSIQDAPEPANALEVTVIGHQFWWEYRYPRAGNSHGKRAAYSSQRSRSSDAYVFDPAFCRHGPQLLGSRARGKG